MRKITVKVSVDQEVIDGIVADCRAAIELLARLRPEVVRQRLDAAFSMAVAT